MVCYALDCITWQLYIQTPKLCWSLQYILWSIPAFQTLWRDLTECLFTECAKCVKISLPADGCAEKGKQFD